MIFEKIVSEGLAHNSYFIGSAGEAAVIDPRRDCYIYPERAVHNNVRITHIFETHRNEDYVIGSVELAQITGADIYHGSALNFGYGNPVHDKDIFTVGNLELQVLETPGHTDESISITLKDLDMTDKVYMVFTGDTLFAGEVGRTDMYGPHETDRLSIALYHSLFEKLLPLGDGVIVCPGHGAGSVCGAKLSEHPFTTIGYEKKTNLALQLTKKEFITHKSNEKLYMPPYFKKMEEYNKNGPPLLHGLPLVCPLPPKKIKEIPAQILDVRNPPSFSGAHIPGSINIWRQGVSLFTGWMFTYDEPIIIVDESNRITDVVQYLARIGYDNVKGFLAGGFPAWIKSSFPMGMIDTWSVHDLNQNLTEDIFLLDVREITNFKEDGYIKGAHHIYVGDLPHKLDEIPKDTHIVVYCDSGFKTSIATSFLKVKGYKNLTNVLGGTIAWKKAEYPMEMEQ
ncbi:MAG: MBL fold metallo-hydrolase [Candidatus Methanofastidiosia archaeon]